MRFLFYFNLHLGMHRNNSLKQHLYLIPPQIPGTVSPPIHPILIYHSDILPPTLLTHQDAWVIQSSPLNMQSFAKFVFKRSKPKGKVQTVEMFSKCGGLYRQAEMQV